MSDSFFMHADGLEASLLQRVTLSIAFDSNTGFVERLDQLRQDDALVVRERLLAIPHEEASKQPETLKQQNAKHILSNAKVIGAPDYDELLTLHEEDTLNEVSRPSKRNLVLASGVCCLVGATRVVPTKVNAVTFDLAANWYAVGAVLFAWLSYALATYLVYTRSDRARVAARKAKLSDYVKLLRRKIKRIKDLGGFARSALHGDERTAVDGWVEQASATVDAFEKSVRAHRPRTFVDHIVPPVFAAAGLLSLGHLLWFKPLPAAPESAPVVTCACAACPATAPAGPGAARP
jgi:hypothetical protein